MPKPDVPPHADAASSPIRVDVSRRGRWILFVAVCCLGISALITQLTLMRELLGIFSGNELIFGIVLGNWLLLNGIGSAVFPLTAGRTASRLNSPLTVLAVAHILVAVLPIANVFLLRVLRNVVFVRGAEVGVTETVISCLVLLAPYCIIAGYLLTLACLILATEEQDASSIGRVYFLDNIGDVIGGLLFSFVLIWLPSHFDILYVPALLNLLLACAVAVLARRPVLLAAAATVAAATIALIATCDLEELSTGIRYHPQRVEYHGHSPYGRLVVTSSGRQVNFIENDVLLFSTGNIERAEQTVHYAMAQRPDARRVLLISGGVSGTAAEILKYDVAAVDPFLLQYVELDPLIVEVARDFVPGCLDDDRIEVITTDGRLHVKQTDRRYDVVIVDVPDPSTFQINRFYTREFFEEVRRVLVDGGVLSFTLGHYAHFLSSQRADMLAVGHRTVTEVFGNTLVVPDERSGRVFFLASDGPLTTDVATRIEQKGIDVRLMRRHYLETVFEQIDDLRLAFSDDAAINEDLNPVLCYYDLRLWMSKFSVRFGLLEGGLLVLLVVYLLRIRPVPLAMFTTGFAASALEIVLLVGFQILCGSVYHHLSLIVTMFMLGLGVGSLGMNRMLARRGRRDLVKLELAIAAFAGLLPLVLIALSGLGGASAVVAARVVIPLLALLLAVLVGMEFPLAGKADFRAVTTTASRLYTADYIGAALGALLVSTLLIPLFGVVAVCLLAAGLNVLSGVVLLVTSRS